jgi:hypothetical protein
MIFNIGDLVQLNYSEHIGIVIEKTDWAGADARPGPFEEPDYSYRIKWAVGEPLTWEKPECLIMKARVNNE